MINIVTLIIIWVLWNINVIVIIIINNINLLNILPRPVKTDTCDTCEKMVVEIGMASTGCKEQLELAYEEHNKRANKQINMLKTAEERAQMHRTVPLAGAQYVQVKMISLLFFGFNHY